MTAAIILAAGESSRLGRPKQNLLFQGQTLLNRTIDAAKGSNCDPVIVVLGANAEKITPIKDVITLYNKDWIEGMASSIRTGINGINGDFSVHRAIILLCDQPFVSAELLNSLIGMYKQTGKPIVACSYKRTMGVPALFDRTLFGELLSLQGQQGAKKIFKAYVNQVVIVPFEKGSIDIDTPDDYHQLRKPGD